MSDNREKARAVAKSTTAASFRLEKGEQMSDEWKALNSLALMRDQKVVFLGVRSVLNDTLTDAGKLAAIAEYYAAFDNAHPPPAGRHSADEQCVFCASQGEAVTVKVDSPDGCPHVFVGRRWLPGDPT